MKIDKPLLLLCALLLCGCACAPMESSSSASSLAPSSSSGTPSSSSSEPTPAAPLPFRVSGSDYDATNNVIHTAIDCKFYIYPEIDTSGMTFTYDYPKEAKDKVWVSYVDGMGAYDVLLTDIDELELTLYASGNGHSYASTVTARAENAPHYDQDDLKYFYGSFHSAQGDITIDGGGIHLKDKKLVPTAIGKKTYGDEELLTVTCGQVFNYGAMYEAHLTTGPKKVLTIESIDPDTGERSDYVPLAYPSIDHLRGIYKAPGGHTPYLFCGERFDKDLGGYDVYEYNEAGGYSRRSAFLNAPYFLLDETGEEATIAFDQIDRLTGERKELGLSPSGQGDWVGPQGTAYTYAVDALATAYKDTGQNSYVLSFDDDKNLIIDTGDTSKNYGQGRIEQDETGYRYVCKQPEDADYLVLTFNGDGLTMNDKHLHYASTELAANEFTDRTAETPLERVYASTSKDHTAEPIWTSNGFELRLSDYTFMQRFTYEAGLGGAAMIHATYSGHEYRFTKVALGGLYEQFSGEYYLCADAIDDWLTRGEGDSMSIYGSSMVTGIMTVDFDTAAKTAHYGADDYPYSYVYDPLAESSYQVRFEGVSIDEIEPTLGVFVMATASGESIYVRKECIDGFVGTWQDGSTDLFKIASDTYALTYDGNPTNYDLRLYVIENSRKVGLRLQAEEGETLVTYLLTQGDEEGTLSLYQELQTGALEFVKTLTKKAS